MHQTPDASVRALLTAPQPSTEALPLPTPWKHKDTTQQNCHRQKARVVRETLAVQPGVLYTDILEKEHAAPL